MCGFRRLTSSARQAQKKSDSSSYLQSDTCTLVGSHPSVEGHCASTAFFTLLDHLPARRLTWPTSSHKSDLQVFFFFLFKPFPSSAPPRACLYFPPATFHRWPEGGEGRWQGSLHHKTPAGHCPQQLPHGITASLSASEWTGPVCHIADTRKWECVWGAWGIKR